jgi:hypothetical protein
MLQQVSASNRAQHSGASAAHGQLPPDERSDVVRFQNFTKLDSGLLREIIRFTCPPGVSGFDIAFKNSARSYRGRAYTNGTRYHWRTCKRTGRFIVPQLIVIGVHRYPAWVIKKAERLPKPLPGHGIAGSKWTAPLRWPARGGYLPTVAFSETEIIVHLVAHELRHLWQRRVKKWHRVWGARGQFSQRDADAYAIQKVRQWRRR